jgi:hypothetical protein
VTRGAFNDSIEMQCARTPNVLHHLPRVTVIHPARCYPSHASVIVDASNLAAIWGFQRHHAVPLSCSYKRYRSRSHALDETRCVGDWRRCVERNRAQRRRVRVAETRSLR